MHILEQRGACCRRSSHTQDTVQRGDEGCKAFRKAVVTDVKKANGAKQVAGSHTTHPQSSLLQDQEGPCPYFFSQIPFVPPLTQAAFNAVLDPSPGFLHSPFSRHSFSILSYEKLQNFSLGGDVRLMTTPLYTRTMWYC